MPEETLRSVGIFSVDRIDDTIVIIGLTDGSTISFELEELLALRPNRSRQDEPADPA